MHFTADSTSSNLVTAAGRHLDYSDHGDICGLYCWRRHRRPHWLGSVSGEVGRYVTV
jgi:hypothetical protein